MTYKVEISFSSKLTNAMNLLTIIETFTNYQPTQQQDTAVNFKDFINEIIIANDLESTTKYNYIQAVVDRKNAFSKNHNSLKKLLVPVRSSILSQYGSRSIQFIQINNLITTMREGRLLKKIVDDGITELNYSRSHQSFAALQTHFGELIQALQTFIDYNPTNPDCTIQQLQNYYQDAKNLSNNVMLKFIAVKNIKTNRQQLYQKLREQSTRIKAYIKSQYGYTSVQFSLVKGLSI